MKKRLFLFMELIGGALSLLIAFMVAFPIIWIIFTSLKNNEEMFRIPVAILPTEFYYKNYLDVLGLSKFRGYFLNSIIITGFSTIINIMFSALAAFAFSRFSLEKPVCLASWYLPKYCREFRCSFPFTVFG